MSETHPSYGVISISKISGSHDSPFGASGYYGQMACICISSASVEIDREKHLFEIYEHQRLLEVQMTPLQLAQAMTGVETPCNISWKDGKFIKPAEKITTRREIIEEDFRLNMTALGKGCDELLEYARALKEKASVNKGDREAFVQLAEDLVKKITAAQPYIASKFTDYVQNVLADIAASKQELVLPPKKGTGNTLSVNACAEQFDLYGSANERPDRADAARAYHHCATFLRECCRDYNVVKDLPS